MSLPERRVEMGRAELGDNSRLEVVVRMRRVLSEGRRAARRFIRSDIGVEEGMGKERVVGRLRPGKEVRKTLMVLSSIAAAQFLSRSFCWVCANFFDRVGDERENTE